MANPVSFASSLNDVAPLLPKQFPSLDVSGLHKNRTHRFKINANLGGGNELKPKGKRKFITQQEEPDRYWQTAGEREGENPMKTPLPYIILFGMSTPFVILGIAFANGWINVPVR